MAREAIYLEEEAFLELFSNLRTILDFPLMIVFSVSPCKEEYYATLTITLGLVLLYYYSELHVLKTTLGFLSPISYFGSFSN